ncbi:MAG: hypothetical protein DRZ76_01890 [Candidatus Nealsonbacteria bacterium]|nr:MAG: hypothetical protein DRZ76_01890 [Candidatus Nealsonbacteria bacterium]
MEKFKYLAKNKISNLPKTPGVYAFLKSRKFLYIGKAVNLRDRAKQHKKLLGLAEQVAYVETASETKALLLEAKLIKKYQPKYNVGWKDDKNYFYVGVTKEEFPRVFITHQPKVQITHGRKLFKSDYIGPFVNGRELKQALKDLRKTHPYRTCKTLPRKPCLWYHLNQCPAPCLFKSRRIEAYDISNIQGKEATGSMVTFINGKPSKSFYRKFKIKGAAEPNDVAMLKEVLSRRFNHPEWGLPDLILIDGGRAQLNAAINILNQPKLAKLSSIGVLALAKRKNELYMKNLETPILLKNLPREIFNLILQLRDEAHRFARKYHHQLRKKHLLE